MTMMLRVLVIPLAFGGGLLAGSLGHVHRDTREPVAVPMASWAAEPRKAPELVGPVDIVERWSGGVEAGQYLRSDGTFAWPELSEFVPDLPERLGIGGNVEWTVVDASPQQVLTLAALPATPDPRSSMLTVNGSDGVKIEILYDGTVTFEGDIDEVSKTFWRAMGSAMPLCAGAEAKADSP